MNSKQRCIQSRINRKLVQSILQSLEDRRLMTKNNDIVTRINDVCLKPYIDRTYKWTKLSHLKPVFDITYSDIYSVRNTLSGNGCVFDKRVSIDYLRHYDSQKGLIKFQ